MIAGGNIALPRRAERISQYQSLIPKGDLHLCCLWERRGASLTRTTYQSLRATDKPAPKTAGLWGQAGYDLTSSGTIG